MLNPIKQGLQWQGHMLIQVRKEEAVPAVPPPPAPQGPRTAPLLLLRANLSWWWYEAIRALGSFAKVQCLLWKKIAVITLSVSKLI